MDDYEPLHCFAVASRRYVLFNRDRHGRPVLRKASAHALGHYLPPYDDDEAPADIPAPADPQEIELQRWQYDLWYLTADAACTGRTTPDLSRLPNLDRAAVSLYPLSLPRFLAWFDTLNDGRPYPHQVRPFNALLLLQADLSADWDDWLNEAKQKQAGPLAFLPRVVAPYQSDTAQAAGICFDRESGRPVPRELLRSYRDVLGRFSRHGENKFLNAGFDKSGPTRPRHVQVQTKVYIGKETNRWEEQSYDAADPDETEVVYGIDPAERARIIDIAREAAARFGYRALALFSTISLKQISLILQGKVKPTIDTLCKLARGAAALDARYSAEEVRLKSVLVLAAAAIDAEGLGAFAKRAGLDKGNLSRSMKEASLSASMIEKIEIACKK